jgi:hypothetical protein
MIALLQKKNIMKKITSPNNDGKTKVKIDGFAITRDEKVIICLSCAKTTGCYHINDNYICTRAGYWYDTKKKYKWKIMGTYRLLRWVRKKDKNIRKQDSCS